MSRLRRLFLCDCQFFVTCNLARKRRELNERDFGLLAQAVRSAQQEHGFVLTATPSSIHAIR